MAHRFTILRNGKIEHYENYDDIPMVFENLIAFQPDLPLGPHTDEQHEEIESWMARLPELMKRETGMVKDTDA